MERKQQQQQQQKQQQQQQIPGFPGMGSLFHLSSSPPKKTTEPGSAKILSHKYWPYTVYAATFRGCKIKSIKQSFLLFLENNDAYSPQTKKVNVYITYM